jgi:hypothetical protein
MDVWFLQSPVDTLDFDGDLIVSAHQDNPFAPNIGAYAAHANDATKEFFTLCCSLLEEAPDTHDQFVFQELYWTAEHLRAGREPDTFKNADAWKPTIPKKPKIRYFIRAKVFDAVKFAANEWPIPHEKTLAIHPLCGEPLQTPHGKKMVAKELGAWFGYHDAHGGGGYYHRRGKYW